MSSVSEYTSPPQIQTEGLFYLSQAKVHFILIVTGTKSNSKASVFISFNWLAVEGICDLQLNNSKKLKCKIFIKGDSNG
jgi:hypothetical protein